MSLYEPDEEYLSWESLGYRTGKLEIALAAVGRQVERITERLGLSADEDGAPVTIEPPSEANILDQYMLAWLSRIRDIARDNLATDAQAGKQVRMLLYPPHLPHDGGTAEGCPGCFPPGDDIPRTAMMPASPQCAPGCGHEPEGREIALAPGLGEDTGPGVHFTVQAGDLLTISWSGELRTVICGGTGPGGTLLRDLTAAEQDGLERQQEADDEMRRREAP